MAFTKTSIAFRTPRPVEATTPTVGEERDGKVWDGEKWIEKAEWEARQKHKE